jgi:hypothetical protein
MLLYKYKPPSPFEHVADILINERLYCCPYYHMNDPFEGLFLESIESVVAQEGGMAFRARIPPNRLQRACLGSRPRSKSDSGTALQRHHRDSYPEASTSWCDVYKGQLDHDRRAIVI